MDFRIKKNHMGFFSIIFTDFFPLRASGQHFQKSGFVSVKEKNIHIFLVFMKQKISFCGSSHIPVETISKRQRFLIRHKSSLTFEPSSFKSMNDSCHWGNIFALHTWFPPSLISRTSLRSTSCMDLQCWQSSLQLLMSGRHVIARLGQTTFWAGTSNILSTCASLWLAEKPHGASGVLDACMSTSAGWSSPLQRMMALRWWELGHVENWKGNPALATPAALKQVTLVTRGLFQPRNTFLCRRREWPVPISEEWWISCADDIINRHVQCRCMMVMVCVWEVGSQSPK